MNCTGTDLSVQSNLIGPGVDFPSNVSIAPGAFRKIAETENYPEAISVTIDKFFINHNGAAITVSAILDGIQFTRTWKYVDRYNDKKTLFDLNDCSLESGKDARKNYTIMNYIFMIHEDDLTQ